MSQLFDALRRRRKPAPNPSGGVRRTAHGDAVLATLGYPPARKVRRRGPGLVPLVLLGGVAVIGFVLWSLYTDSGAVTPALRTPVPSATPASRQGPAAPATSAATPSASSPAAPTPAASSPKAAPSTTAAAPPSAPAPRIIAQAVERPPAAIEPRARPATPPPPAAPVTTVERAPARVPSTPRTAAAPPPPVTAPSRSGEAPPAANAFELALYYHRAGDFENALVQYRALLQANELNAQAHNNLGLLYQEKNLLDESARELQRAVLIEPRYARAHNNYGVTLLRQGKLDAAGSEFRTVLSLEPRNVDAMVNLALVEKSAGQAERAKASLLRALTIAPKNAAAHYNLAVVYEETGELARAVDHYRAFLDHTGAEYADRAPAVRARLAALAK